MSLPFKYWAFISYAHADQAWAAWLHRALERYRVPRRLVGREGRGEKIPARLFPVFRDRDELAGSSALGPELQKALQGSRALVVICSPRAAQSRWVGEEIKYFKSLGRADRVFALIVDGEPHALEKGDAELECFPEPLRFHVNDAGRIIGGEAVEPIAADLRPGGDGKGNAKLKLIAGILGIGFDELRQRELQARNRRLGFVAALATATASLTLMLAVQAYYARNDAQRRQRQAEDLIQFMLGDLRDKLEPIGKLDILDVVGDKAMSYFATLDEQDLTDTVLQSRATALRQIGDVRAKQGKLDGAAAAFQEALKLDTALVARHPEDAQTLFNIAESQFSVGYAHYAKGEIEQARPWFERQAQTVQKLVALEPDNPKWRTEAGNAHSNLGTIAVRRGELDKAWDHYQSALASQQSLLESAPDHPDFLTALATTHGWLNYVESLRRDYAKALGHAQAKTRLLRRLTELAPDDAQHRLRLAGGLQQVAYSQSNLRAPSPQDAELREALRLTETLSRHDPTHVGYVRAHGVSLSYLEHAHLAVGELEEARAVNDRALELAFGLFQRAPENSEVIDDLLSTLIRAVKLAWLSGNGAQAGRLLEQATALPLTEKQREEAGPSRWLELALLAQWLEPDAAKKATHAASARRWVERLQAAGGQPRPDLMMRFYALNGDLAEAGRWAAQLNPMERAHPYLAQFCGVNSCGFTGASHN